MPTPPLQIPILQNWSCHNCGGCCREHAITITPEERDRILSQKWSPESGIPAGQPLFVEERSWLGKTSLRLAHQPDGSCVFLDSNGLCRIHAKFGEPAKPLACRIYPYTFHPSGNKLAVSLRFSCPSVADNLGRPVTSQSKDLRSLASQVLPAGYRPPGPPALTAKTTLSWDDTLLIVEAIDQSLAGEAPLPLLMLRILFWLELIEESRFKNIHGERLVELLTLLRGASEVEVPELPEPVAPSKMGEMQFRLLAGLYARKDTAGNQDLTWSGRWRQFQNALSLAKGKGMTPEFDESFKAVPLSTLQNSFGEIPEQSREMLSRYYHIKVQGLHFCGIACYEFPVIEGIHALFLTLPAILHLARWRAASASRTSWTHDDLREALNRVDHQHGFSPALGTWSARRRVRNLVATGDLKRLILQSTAQ